MLGTHRLAYLSKPGVLKRVAQPVNLPASPASRQPLREPPATSTSLPAASGAEGQLLPATQDPLSKTRHPGPAASGRQPSATIEG